MITTCQCVTCVSDFLVFEDGMVASDEVVIMKLVDVLCSDGLYETLVEVYTKSGTERRFKPISAERRAEVLAAAKFGFKT